MYVVSPVGIVKEVPAGRAGVLSTESRLRHSPSIQSGTANDIPELSVLCENFVDHLFPFPPCPAQHLLNGERQVRLEILHREGPKRARLSNSEDWSY